MDGRQGSKQTERWAGQHTDIQAGRTATDGQVGRAETYERVGRTANRQAEGQVGRAEKTTNTQTGRQGSEQTDR